MNPVDVLTNVRSAKWGIGESTRFTRCQEQELGAADGEGLYGGIASRETSEIGH